MRAVPAPHAAVIPDIERADQSDDAVGEQLLDAALGGLGGQVPEPEQAEQEAVEHAGQRVSRILLVQRAAVLEGPHAAVLQAFLEDVRGGAGEVEQVTATVAEPIRADEHADREPLGHGADPRRHQLATALAPVERVRPHDRAVVATHGVPHEPVGLPGEPRRPLGIPSTLPALQAHQSVPGDVRRVVGLAEQARALDRNTVGVQLHGVEEQAFAVDVVAQRAALSGGRHGLHRVAEAEAGRLPPQRPRRPSRGLQHAGPPAREACQRHRFDTSQLPIARCRSPERSSTSRASSGRLTMGKPWRLNEVLSTPPMPVSRRNSLSSA